MLKYIKNEVVMENTRATYDKRALKVIPIKNPIVRYAAMVIGYKVYFKNRDNFVSTTAINVAHEMVVNGSDLELCEFLRKKIMENMRLTKERKYVFKYVTLVMCLLFYFLKEISIFGKENWTSGRPVAL